MPVCSVACGQPSSLSHLNSTAFPCRTNPFNSFSLLLFPQQETWQPDWIKRIFVWGVLSALFCLRVNLHCCRNCNRDLATCDKRRCTHLDTYDKTGPHANQLQRLVWRPLNQMRNALDRYRVDTIEFDQHVTWWCCVNIEKSTMNSTSYI